MKTSSPPAPPDPKETAAAQSQMNRDTATTQYQLNATNQVTPQGNLTYDQIGTWEDGTPRFQATTSYSPEQQAIYDQSSANELSIGKIAGDQIGRIGDLLGSPIQLGNEATEARLFELGRQRLDPMWNDREQAFDQQMINRGIRPGTPAYEAMKRSHEQSRNDSYNSLLLAGRGQAVQEGLTERNQPINEITALMSGSQVSQPNFVGTPTPGVAPTNYAGMVSDQYNSQLAAWNAKQQSQNAMLGGIAGAAGTLGGWAMMSDRRLKPGAIPAGPEDGIERYAFRYVWEDDYRDGVMADEVAHIPGAVLPGPFGFDMVDYGAL